MVQDGRNVLKAVDLCRDLGQDDELSIPSLELVTE
jgi:hypothetical protein